MSWLRLLLEPVPLKSRRIYTYEWNGTYEVAIPHPWSVYSTQQHEKVLQLTCHLSGCIDCQEIAKHAGTPNEVVQEYVLHKLRLLQACNGCINRTDAQQQAVVGSNTFKTYCVAGQLRACQNVLI